MNTTKDRDYNWKDETLDVILMRKKMLEELIEDKTVSLKRAPEGGLRAVNKKTYCQYYLRTDPGDTTGVYITKAKRGLAARLAQKEYDREILMQARKELVLITKLADHLGAESLIRIYENLNPARKTLVNPIYLDDELFIREWRTEEYEPLPFVDQAYDIYSNNGVRVRSKSELIIANMLEQNGIPYRYEYPIVLKDGKNVRPDFLCLNIRTRREYVWEHFGMMDNIAYANSNVTKIAAYERSGYYAGGNMIMTFETSQCVLNSNTVMNMIRRHLK